MSGDLPLGTLTAIARRVQQQTRFRAEVYWAITINHVGGFPRLLGQFVGVASAIGNPPGHGCHVF